MIHSAILEYDKQYSNLFDAEELKGKRTHIGNVVKFTEKLLALSHNKEIDPELLFLSAKHHDDGRALQFELIGKFWDGKLSHNVLGLELFDKFVQQGNYNELNEDVEVFRNVILYHGRVQLCMSAKSKSYVELITAADDIDNAASCISYLVKEVETDAKGYIAKDPEADQQKVSEFVFEHFASGEKFDKAKYCTTYAEYVLFAATLMTSYMKKYNFVKEILLEPGYGYSSIINGYKDVFEKTLSPEIASKAIKVIEKYVD